VQIARSRISTKRGHGMKFTCPLSILGPHASGVKRAAEITQSDSTRDACVPPAATLRRDQVGSVMCPLSHLRYDDSTGIFVLKGTCFHRCEGVL